jgi:hypothetical protein
LKEPVATGSAGVVAPRRTPLSSEGRCVPGSGGWKVPCGDAAVGARNTPLSTRRDGLGEVFGFVGVGRGKEPLSGGGRKVGFSPATGRRKAPLSGVGRSGASGARPSERVGMTGSVGSTGSA